MLALQKCNYDKCNKLSKGNSPKGTAVKPQFDEHLVEEARSRYFRQFCLILLIMSSKGQIGRAQVFHLQSHGHITIENDIFQLCK